MTMSVSQPGLTDIGHLWVFAYGSLMWNPCFAYAANHKGVIHGYSRSLCVWSVELRGTRGCPGLVFGLCAGAFCEGVAFLVERDQIPDALTRLANRELDSDAYLPRFLEVQLTDGRLIECLTFVANAASPHYADNLTIARAVRIVSRAMGSAGSNGDYVQDCWSACRNYSISDLILDAVIAALNPALE